MFRLPENVPEIYTSHSRDFQMFCRVYDIINNATRYSCESAETLLDPTKASDNILTLLASRIGFFPKHSYNNHALRCILSAFPYFIKYKGSKRGIEMVVNTLLRAEGSSSDSEVLVDSEQVYIYTENQMKNEALLRDVLSYILPIGYGLSVSTFSRTTPDTIHIDGGITYTTHSEHQADISVIVSTDYDSDNYTGSYVMTQILDNESEVNPQEEND